MRERLVYLVRNRGRAVSRGHWIEAFEYNTAIALKGNWANPFSHRGWRKFLTGSIGELAPARVKPSGSVPACV